MGPPGQGTKIPLASGAIGEPAHSREDPAGQEQILLIELFYNKYSNDV